MGHRAPRTDAPKVRFLHPMDAPYPIEVVPVSEYVEHARGELEPLFEQAHQEEMALRAAEDRGTSRVKKSSAAIRRQQDRVQALLDAPGETDWGEYDQEVGILLHMMPDPDDYELPVEQPPVAPERTRRPGLWIDTIWFVMGLSGLLWAIFLNHAAPESLALFASMLGMPAILRAAPSSDKL